MARQLLQHPWVPFFLFYLGFWFFAVIWDCIFHPSDGQLPGADRPADEAPATVGGGHPDGAFAAGLRPSKVASTAVCRPSALPGVRRSGWTWADQ
jgi:hypothetical protein